MIAYAVGGGRGEIFYISDVASSRPPSILIELSLCVAGLTSVKQRTTGGIHFYLSS